MITMGVRANKTYQIAGVGQDTTKELAEQHDASLREAIAAKAVLQAAKDSAVPQGGLTP